LPSKGKGKKIIELRKLCGDHRTVPSAYKLKEVIKTGTHSQVTSQVAEVWKGKYKDGQVALKIFRIPPNDPKFQRIKKVCLFRGQEGHTNGHRSNSAKRWY
jgi:hypothetical protein